MASPVASGNISLLKNAFDKSPQTIGALEVIDRIGNGFYAEPIKAVRECYQNSLQSTNGDHKAAKKAVATLKKALPAVQWSGVFSSRSDKRVTSYSGLLCADLDQLDEDTIVQTLEALTLDQHCYTTFISPTGTSIKAVFRVSPLAEDHQRNYEAVESHVSKTYSLNVDASCNNMERLCFVSDSVAHRNENAMVLAALPPNPRKLEDSDRAPRSLASPAGRQDIARGC